MYTNELSFNCIKQCLSKITCSEEKVVALWYLRNSNMLLLIKLLSFKSKHRRNSLSNNQKKIKNSPKRIFHVNILKNWPIKTFSEND